MFIHRNRWKPIDGIFCSCKLSFDFQEDRRIRVRERTANALRHCRKATSKHCFMTADNRNQLSQH